MASPVPIHPADQTLVSYGLGKLDDTLAETIGAHLEGCAACRQRVSALSDDSFVGRLRDAQLPPVDVAARANVFVASPPRHYSLGSAEQSSVKTAPSSNVTLPPELVNHPQYEVLQELDRGGMGVVYLARNKLMDRLEVLKVLNRDRLSQQETVERFEREIQSAAKLHHPNVVAAHTAFSIGDGLVFAMEYVDGVNLEKLVRDRGPLPVTAACLFALQAAQGLQHAHERGMIHRDIKPSNLILFREGKKAVVKILDFGLAKLADLGDVGTGLGIDPKLTQDGYVLGTPDYVAPEQAINPRTADIRADIYSLGCTLYALLAGDAPFFGNSVQEILRAHQSMEPSPLELRRPDVPAALATVVATMMAKDPNGRYQTPAEVVHALRPFLKQDRTPRRQPGPGTVAARMTRSVGMPEGSGRFLGTDLNRDVTAVIARVGRFPWYRVAWVVSVTVVGAAVAWYGGALVVKTRENAARLQDRLDQQGRPSKTPSDVPKPSGGTGIDAFPSPNELGTPFGKPPHAQTARALPAPKVAQLTEISPEGNRVASAIERAKDNIKGTEAGADSHGKTPEPRTPTVMIQKMKVETLNAGTGDQQAKQGDFLTVNYANMLADHKKIDSTYDRGRRPLTFKLGTDPVLEGWHLGLVGIKVGEKRRLTIPPELAFAAARTTPPGIPRDATIISVIELLELVPGAQ